LAPGTLLHRLYHQEQLEIHDPRALRAACRCSAERVENTLRSFPKGEIESLTDEQDKIVVTCEYCKSTYSFDRDALERLYAL
jgi:molecular chaperone Hsp33